MKTENLEASDLLEVSDVLEYIKNNGHFNEVLRDIITELPALEQSIVYMRFWEDKDPYEISYECGFSVNTVSDILEGSFDFLKDRVLFEFQEGQASLLTA